MFGGAKVNRNSSLSDANFAMISSNMPVPVPFSGVDSEIEAIGGIKGVSVEGGRGGSKITLFRWVSVKLLSLRVCSGTISSAIGSWTEGLSFPVSALTFPTEDSTIAGSKPSNPATKKKSAKAAGAGIASTSRTQIQCSHHTAASLYSSRHGESHKSIDQTVQVSA